MAEVFLHPGEEFTVTELARRTGVSQPVVHKEVSRLIDAEVLSDRREGNNRLVRVNQSHLLYSPAAEIIQATYGPVPVLRELLAGMDGVLDAFIYGSWAARRMGESGGLPRDIDVLVVGEVPIDAMLDVQQAARDRLGLDVNIHRTSESAWADRRNDEFLSHVSSRPLIRLAGKGADDE